MSASVNPLLHQVLHRRRLRRRTQQAALAWVFFGGLHIAVWWAAFNSTGKFSLAGSAGHADILQLAVWPLLLVASASFVAMIVYGLRWLYAPGNPEEFDWLEDGRDDEAPTGDRSDLSGETPRPAVSAGS